MRNRSAIGARVTVEPTIDGQSRVLVREVNAHSGWRSQSDRRLHFGLGDATTVDSLVVRWPSGATTRQENLAVDRVIEIEETAEHSINGRHARRNRTIR